MHGQIPFWAYFNTTIECMWNHTLKSDVGKDKKLSYSSDDYCTIWNNNYTPLNTEEEEEVTWFRPITSYKTSTEYILINVVTWVQYKGKRRHIMKLFKPHFESELRKHPFNKRIIDDWNSVAGDIVWRIRINKKTTYTGLGEIGVLIDR